MGYNLYSACHKCKVKIFHFRREEQKTILPFYAKHSKCAKENIDNVQTIMDNNGTDQEWQNSFENGGYKDDELQE
jgi:hypothetical protein